MRLRAKKKKLLFSGDSAKMTRLEAHGGRKFEAVFKLEKFRKLNNASDLWHQIFSSIVNVL